TKHSEKLAKDPFYTALGEPLVIHPCPVLDPFYTALGEPLVIHVCSKSSGHERIKFALAEGWKTRSEKGGKVHVVAQVYTIPLAKNFDNGDDLPTIPAACWNKYDHVRAGDASEEFVELPISKSKNATSSFPHSVILDDSVDDSVVSGDNILRYFRDGDRCCFVVRLVEEVEVDTVVARIASESDLATDWGRKLLKKMGVGDCESDSDDDVMVTDMNLSLKCPITTARITHPARGNALVNARVTGHADAEANCPR
ncbi:hypothetical protein T484DRAFT_1840946, partial [Baffinella frigidus]